MSAWRQPAERRRSHGAGRDTAGRADQPRGATGDRGGRVTLRLGHRSGRSRRPSGSRAISRCRPSSRRAARPAARLALASPKVRKKRRFGWGKRIVALVSSCCLAARRHLLVMGRRPAPHRRAEVLSRAGSRNTTGTNWLIVGSDSRADLTAAAAARRWPPADAAGSRTDTIMIVHTGSKKTTLLSLPRDTYVPIDGHGRNKLNAAFAFGGASLLVQTVEEVTGLHIDHYAEIGFGGFASMVDAVGGVRICVDQAINDGNAGLNIKAGCQKLERRPGARLRPQPQVRDRRPRARPAPAPVPVGAAVQGREPRHADQPVQVDPARLRRRRRAHGRQGQPHLGRRSRSGWRCATPAAARATRSRCPSRGFANEGAVGSVVLWDRTKALELFAALKNDQPLPGGPRPSVP